MSDTHGKAPHYRRERRKKAREAYFLRRRSRGLLNSKQKRTIKRAAIQAARAVEAEAKFAAALQGGADVPATV